MPRVPRQDGTDRRPRSDSALMSLPDERQRELFDFCDGHRKDGLRKIRELLKDEQGVEVSIGTLSNWLNWYSLRSKLANVSEMADSVARILKETPGLDLDDAKIMRAAQAFFEAKAMQENDAGTYVRLAGVRRGTAEIRIKERRLTLEEKKFAAVRAAVDNAVKTGALTVEGRAEIEKAMGMM